MNPTDSEPSNLVNHGRRRFARGGLAVPVVLGSLASKPVLGAEVPYICSISGQMSGNTSMPRDLQFDCNTLGRSPGYWKSKNGVKAWVGYQAGELEASKQGCACPAMKKPGTTFQAAFGVNAFRHLNCEVYDARQGFPTDSGTKEATMLQVLMTGGGLNDSALKALGRAAVASLLNASSPTYRSSYPLTPQQVIDMFRAVYLPGGTYPIPGSTVSWNADQVKDYFESLYGAL